MTNASELHVVLGSGPLGLAVARQLAEQRRRVRIVNRVGRAAVPQVVDGMAADLADPTEALRACAGAAVVYHCANPPYAQWPQLHPPLMRAVITGAAASEAKLVFGDNLYAYGPVDGPLTEGLPHRAAGLNGRTRVEISEVLLRAHREGRVRVAIGRSSDFFGPHAVESMVGSRVFDHAVRGKPAQLLGNPDLPHTVTYIEDFAKALITLGDRDDALGGVWHVPNSRPAITLRQFVGLVFEAAGQAPRLRTVPRQIIAALALFNSTLRAVKEQLYQVEHPWVVDSSRFELAFGWQATALEEAVGETVGWFAQRVGREAERSGRN